MLAHRVKSVTVVTVIAEITVTMMTNGDITALTACTVVTGDERAVRSRQNTVVMVVAVVMVVTATRVEQRNARTCWPGPGSHQVTLGRFCNA